MKYSNIPNYVVLLYVIGLPYIEISIRLSSSLSPHEFISADSSGPLRFTFTLSGISARLVIDSRDVACMLKCE